MRMILFLIAAALVSACGTKERPLCPSQETCLNDPNCECWCSQKCGYRKKEKEDRPIYIENDPNGKFCYCKQWDLDYYEDNCIEGKHIEQTH